MWKNRQFTFLNLLGLSTGLACTLLILLWVNDELHFDKFHENDARLYQVMANARSSEGVTTGPQTPAPLAEGLSREMPEIQYAAATQVSFTGKYSLSAGDKSLKATGLYATKDFLQVFSFPLVAGDKSTVLRNKGSVVISRRLAESLFGTSNNVVGRMLRWQQSKTFLVSGVMDEVPSNSSLQFDFLLSMDVFLDANPDDRQWNTSDPSTYVVLKQGADAGLFNKKIAGFLKSKDKNSSSKLFIRPFSDGYLYNSYANGVVAGGRIEYVRLFFIVALVILVIASINFMNLTTAKASVRMKEVGIRKVVGASRRDLVFRYLGESLLMSFLSLLIAIGLMLLLLPAFNQITGKDLAVHFEGGMIGSVLGILLFTGLLSGSYPALYLSGFRPVAVLKGRLKNSVGELWVRRGLVVFQFTLSVVFIVTAIVVYRQIQFIQSNNKGFNKDNVISFNAEGLTQENMPTFLAGVESFLGELRDVPGVVRASSMDHGSIVGDFGTTADISWPGKSPKETVNFGNIGVNYGLIETLGMQIVEGRSFNRKLSSDSSEIIFNEAAIQAMHLQDPIGKVVHMWDKDRRIAGVVKNFHFESVHEVVKPFALRLEPLFTYRILARIQAGKEQSTLAAIQELYRQRYPGFPFDYAFLDQQYQAQYVAETRVAELSRYFTGLAILISCLGLFGLAAFTAERRFKEIGIRKVLGASAGRIVVLLSGDFLRLVGVAIILAFPLAGWVTNRWLNSFAYRVHVSGAIFVLAAASIVLITLVTISFQSIRAAIANPVNNLKAE